MRYLCLYINNTRLVLPKHFRNIVLVCGVFLLLMSIGAQQAWSQPPVCETNTVFVTEEIYSMNLLGAAQSNFLADCAGAATGLEGADCICQQLADAEGLGGIYKAWLSTDVDSPSTTFPQSIFPYVLVNGAQVADNWTDLTDGDIDTCIRIDQTGTAKVAMCAPDNVSNSNFAVLTNTLTDGTSLGGTNCSDWTSIASMPGVQGGIFDHTNDEWTIDEPTSFNCDNTDLFLYCFEQCDNPPPAVPTLSQWGLIAMAGILGIVGFMVMRRGKAVNS